MLQLVGPKWESPIFFSLRLGVFPLFPPVVRSLRNRFSFLALSISSTLRTKRKRPPDSQDTRSRTSRMKTLLPRQHHFVSALLLCFLLLLLPRPSQQGSSGSGGAAAIGANRTKDASPTVRTIQTHGHSILRTYYICYTVHPMVHPNLTSRIPVISSCILHLLFLSRPSSEGPPPLAAAPAAGAPGGRGRGRASSGAQSGDDEEATDLESFRMYRYAVFESAINFLIN